MGECKFDPTDLHGDSGLKVKLKRHEINASTILEGVAFNEQIARYGSAS